jgi:pimeloyl-ACP methyl ester carboxylesterase
MTQLLDSKSATGWREEFVEVAGLRIQVQKAGSGPPLLLLPDDIGVPGWLPFHQELAASFSICLVSHPGFGRSDRPEWARSVRDLAALEVRLLESLGLEGCDVVGIGFGGWVAAEMASFCRHAFNRMVLVAPAGLKPLEGEIYDQFLGRGPAYARAGFFDLGRFEELHGDATDLDTLEQWEINREMTARVAWAPYLFSQSLPHFLPLVGTPALIVWGAQDAIIPASEAGHWADLLPKARSVLIEQSGHRVDVEQPGALAGAVRDFITPQ